MELEDLEKDRRRKRAAKFGTAFDESAAVSPSADLAMEQLEKGTPLPRRDAQKSELLRDTALHVHGARFLSSADVIRLFQGQGAGSLEWVSNDSCNVVFDSTFACKRVILALGAPDTGADSTMKEAGNAAQGDSILPWYSLKGSPLAFRQAVVTDRKSLLTEIYRCLKKEDAPAAECLKAGSAFSDLPARASKRVKPQEGDWAVPLARRDLDRPEGEEEEAALSVPAPAPVLFPQALVQPQFMDPTVQAGEEVEGVEEDLRDVLRRRGREGDLRDKLKRKEQGEDLRERLMRNAESRVGTKTDKIGDDGVGDKEDLRHLLDRHKSRKGGFQGPRGEAETKKGRIFLQTIEKIKQVASEADSG